MRSIKPLSLFDTRGRNAFFKPLQSNLTLSSASVIDETLIGTRKKVSQLSRQFTHWRNQWLQFCGWFSSQWCSFILICCQFLQVLCRIVTEAVKSLGEPTFDSPHSSSSHKLPTHAHTYTYWTTLVLKVAKSLLMNVDDVNRHLCCELYSSGWDKLAQEVSDRVCRLLDKIGQTIDISRSYGV